MTPRRGRQGGGATPVRMIAALAIAAATVVAAACADEIRVGPVPEAERERLDLAGCYTRYARAADGIPVVATDRVRPEAVAEAVWLIDRMLAKRPDVARAIARSPVRFVVMAHDEFTTDVPEHADLKPRAYWDKRARGLGATLARPATSCGEENLLCFPGDPYSAENILIHEFGHTIHEFGLAQADPTFQERLEAAFALARENGRWKGTYAGTNVVEYWAEGVQGWFCCNRTRDHQHGEINSPEALREYDPPLAALLEEVFGAEPWCYVRPQDRAAADRAHVAGFDAAAAPAFDWKNIPERGDGKRLLIDLDAAALPVGPLRACTAAGTAQATFTAGGAASITAEAVAGRRAVTFAGGDGLVSSFAAPDSLTGRSAFTVSAWVFNPKVGGEEPIVQWAKRGADGRAAIFGQGTAPTYGAIMHWGEGDMGFEGRVPAAGTWHHVAVTHAGGVDGEERLYVDGAIVATEKKSLDLWPGGRIHVGRTGDGPGWFTGSLALVRLDAAALPPEAVAALARGAGVEGEPVVLLDAALLAEGPVMDWANAGSAGGTFRRASIPSVDAVAGRQAIVCEGSERLVGDAPLAGLAGAAPFTLEAWVLNPEVGNGEGYAALVAPERPPVVFQYARGMLDGGFAADRGGLAFAVTPAAGAWHHLAVTSAGGDRGTVSLYVDGELAARREMKVTVAESARLVIGGAGRRGYSGAIARLRLHDAALDQAVLRRGAGMTHAFDPKPARGATVAVRTIPLEWRAGVEGVARFHVYAAVDRGAVERRDAAVRIADVAASTTSVAGPLLPIGATCAWCVDQVGVDGSVASPGVVWTFAVDDGRAREPAPRDRTANTPVEAGRLAWTPGPFATGQRLFLGADEAAVRDATEPDVTLAADARSCPVPGTLEPGTRYFWRVDTVNGDAGTSRGETWAFRTQDAAAPGEFTFFVVTDTHYTPEPASYAGVRTVIDAMNWLPGTAYPEAFGGTVRTPRGVIHGGDMLDDGMGPTAAAVWQVFTSDFGVNGEGRVCYPVFEIVGNHDGGDGGAPQEGVRARNRERRGLAAVSDNGLHYSWDWDDVHFVALNKFSGSGPDPERPFNQPWNDPGGSLEFLAADLGARGGGKPVILLQHYGFDDFSAGWGWWSPRDRARTWDAIRDFNVVAYLHGHTHGMTFMKWRGDEIHGPGRTMPSEGIDVIGCGAGQRGPEAPGEFMVFRVRKDEIAIAHRFIDRWGATLRIPIPPAPRWPRPGAAASSAPATAPTPSTPGVNP